MKNKKTILGVAIFIILILIIIGFKVFSDKNGESNNLANLKTVYVATGGGKEDFIAEVEKRSYALFEERQRCGKEGNSLTDWLEAEAEIKAKYGL